VVGLLDIAPTGQDVPFRDGTLRVRGVGAKGLSRLFSRFPDLAKMVQGGGIDVGALLALGGDAIAAVIAEGLGQPGDEATEAKVDDLTFDEVADLLEAILRQTMPGGVVPFAARLEKLGAVLNPQSALAGKAPASK
jgi:hypothetical protein